MIVVDTGGILALLNRNDRHHFAVRRYFEEHGQDWVIPWAVLPEVDYLANTRLGEKVANAFIQDVHEGAFYVDAEVLRDVTHAQKILGHYAALNLGLVDAVVMAQAERHQATAIVTTDVRHFRAVNFSTKPKPLLIPADLS